MWTKKVYDGCEVRPIKSNAKLAQNNKELNFMLQLKKKLRATSLEKSKRGY